MDPVRNTPAHGVAESYLAEDDGGVMLHGVVRGCLKIFSGRVSSTPTASLPSTEDMGLLMFLNLKQAHLNRSTAGIDLYRYPTLQPLLSIIEFINYVVGGLIVEAEKIDEMHIAIKKEVIRREARLDYHVYDQKVRAKGSGTQVEQILALHYPKPAATSVRSSHLYNNIDEQQLQTLQNIDDDKWVLKELKHHLRVASTCRVLLHGKVTGGMDPNTADGVVQELGIAQTFRKAMHKVRDIQNEVRDKEALPALQTLSQFMDYLHYGVAVALDELENCELMVRKRSVGEVADRKIHVLEAKDKENKRASCSALRFNSIVNSPKKRLYTATNSEQHRVFTSRPTAQLSPPRSNISAEPYPNHPTTYQSAGGGHYMQQQHQPPVPIRDAELLYDDGFLDSYCCD